MNIIDEFVSHGGRQLVVKHYANTTNCDMTFAIFLPPGEGPFPVLWYLSGLTCTHANVMEKGEYRKAAAELGIAIICPDTSPRGADIPGADPEDWQLGQGAGFYVNATEPPFDTNYQMYNYVTDELPELVFKEFNLDVSKQSIFGHSMGGHGAMICALKKPKRFKSCSAFAPINSPSTEDWSIRAFNSYLGNDESTWRAYDSVCLIEDGATIEHLLVDQGEADSFLNNGLSPNKLVDVCKQHNVALELRMQPGYDHSYYFISSFMHEHIKWHASKLA